MINETQIKLRKIRLTCICLGLVGLLALSIFSAYYILHRPPFVKEVRVESHVSIAPVHAPAPTAPRVYTGMRYGSLRLSGGSYSYSFTPKSLLPNASMGSTSMRIHQTSDATVHQIGGGGGGMGIATTSGGSNSGRGINYSGAIYVASMSAVTAVGASTATSLATTVTEEPAAAPDRRRVDHNPHGPFPDPVGDVAWPLMALMAIGYALFLYRKRAHA